MMKIDELYNPYVDGGYYNVNIDIEKNQDCWAFFIVGGRGTGKTYGALKGEYIDKKEKFAFVKRTNDDVQIMCTSKRGMVMDLSPFKPINRDFLTNVNAIKIEKGIGGFYNCDEEGNPEGAPVGYICSLNAIGNIKGFDLSDCKAMIFDEFIPNIYERISRKEGESVLDLYRTISRDREFRGQESLKMICLSNATRVYNPLFEEMELVDIVVDMKAKGCTVYKKDGIFLRLLDDNEVFREKESDTAMMRSLKDTKYGKMALNNDFAFDDFSHIGTTSIKRYTCEYAFSVKEKVYYVYVKNNQYYICNSKNPNVEIYDLEVETEQKRFYNEKGWLLYNALIAGNVLCQKFSAYNYIKDYKKIFNI